MDSAHLLIIEDNDALNELITEFFEGEGYTVHSALTGEEGVAMSRQHRVDLALLDIRLPDIDGYIVYGKLREYPATQNIPVILLTERRDRANRLQGLELGVVDYITKPFDVHELRLRVRNALKRSMLRKAANPVTELALALETERKLDELLKAKTEWAAIELRFGPLEAFRTEYGFIAAADLLRAASITVRSVMRDLDLDDCYVGHSAVEDIAVLLKAAQAQGAVNELKKRLADMVPRFLPPKARGQAEPPVQLHVGSVDHRAPGVVDLVSLRAALDATAAPIPYEHR